MLTRFIFGCLLLSCLLPVKAQSGDSLRRMLDSVLHVAQTQSYFSPRVSWPVLKERVYALAGTPQTISDLDSAFYHLLSALGDFHGAVYYRGGGVEYRLPSGRKAYAGQDSISRLMEERKLGLHAQIIGEEFGYLRIPGIQAVTPERITTEAKKILDSICRLPVADLKGWIIDLRFNGGGNIYAMAAGLAGFIPAEKQLKFVNANGEANYVFQMQGANLSSGSFQPTSFEAPCYTIPGTVPVAVLISRHTASSGETLAALLRLRDHTLLIGEETGGYTTGTNYVDIMKMGAINITTAYPVDKSGKPYASLLPDMALEPAFDPGDILQDSYLSESIEWLQKQQGNKEDKSP